MRLGGARLTGMMDRAMSGTIGMEMTGVATAHPRRAKADRMIAAGIGIGIVIETASTNLHMVVTIPATDRHGIREKDAARGAPMQVPAPSR